MVDMFYSMISKILIKNIYENNRKNLKFKFLMKTKILLTK